MLVDREGRFVHNPTDQSRGVGQQSGGLRKGLASQNQAEELPALQRRRSVGD